MPPRLSPRTMLWAGVALAVVSSFVQNVLLTPLLQVAYLPPVVTGVLLSTLQVAFYGGIALAAGAFVVRALQPADARHGRQSEPSTDAHDDVRG